MTDDKVDVTEAKRFDLMAALAGRTYPEKKVTVFLDEALMYLRNEVEEAHLHDPANKDLEALVEKTREELAPMALTVTVKGAPPHLTRSALDETIKEFPPDRQGNLSTEGYEALQQKRWEILVTRIEDAEGNATTPTPEEIAEFRKMAPPASTKAITAAIDSLLEDSETGYHLAIQDLGFLSQP